MYIISRIAIWSSRTTGRFSILWMPRMATSGQLMIGVAKMPPSLPSDVIVKVDELRHVDLLDVREVGRRDVGFRHLLEDALPQPMDRDSLLAAARGDSGCRRRCDNGRPRRAVGDFADVILAEAALRPAPSDRCEIHVEFLREATDRGRREDISGRTGRGRRLRPCRRRWRGGRSSALGPGRNGLARLPENDEGAADLHDLALFRAELKDLSGDGRLVLDGYLIRHDLDGRVVFLDGVPLFHEPLDDLAFVDALPDVGELELAGHRLLSRCLRRKPRGHLNILHVPPRTRLPEMRMILWPLADVYTGRSRVVEEWHRPVGVICARRSAPERFPACSSFL